MSSFFKCRNFYFIICLNWFSFKDDCRQLLRDVKDALCTDISSKVVLDSLCAFLNLGIDKGEMFNKLFSLLEQQVLSNPSDVPIMNLVKLHNSFRNSGFQLPEETKKLLDDVIELKTRSILFSFLTLK